MGIESAIVTGATGPIGIALVHYLAELGITVTALVHPGSKRIRYLSVSGRSRIVECDLGQMGQLTCMPETDAFFHLGWSATDSRSSRDTPEIQASNILHTLDAVKLAQASGCKMFVGVGSQSELWRAELKPHAAAPALVEESYGIAKYAAGRLSLRSCEMRGIRHCWARIMSIYGPGERPTTALMYCVHSLLHGESPSLTKGEQQWDYLYAADAARALYLIAEKGRHGAVYAVGSGCARPLREYFTQLGRLCMCAPTSAPSRQIPVSFHSILSRKGSGQRSNGPDAIPKRADQPARPSCRPAVRRRRYGAGIHPRHAGARNGSRTHRQRR